jgi:hypothetical protein
VGRVPSYHRLLAEVVEIISGSAEPDRTAAAFLASAWSGRRFEWKYDRPLLLFAALRAEALAVGQTHPLWTAIAQEPARAEAVSREAVRAALAPRWTQTYASLQSRTVQTNETSRAVAWLWPAHLAGCDDGGRPLALVDIGASAGLNLVADRLPAIWTDAAGAPLPGVRHPELRLRLGFDIHPLDVGRDEDLAWLRACLWAGERERHQRFEAAVAAFLAARADPAPPGLETAEAADVPGRIETAVRTLPPGTLIIAYQTIFEEYLSAASRRAYHAGMKRWLESAPPARAVWVALEYEVAAKTQLPVALTATVKTSDALATWTLAHCGYHPGAIVPDPAAVAAFGGAVRSDS